ncbi:hypothetical protein W02_22400 [Nitrospira sp. KM1]|nr:hypothetical protein W02_22400 [Nitrospira sp. KM1]
MWRPDLGLIGGGRHWEYLDRSSLAAEPGGDLPATDGCQKSPYSHTAHYLQQSLGQSATEQ